MKIWQIFAAGMLLTGLLAGGALADSHGSKRFACIEMHWQQPANSETVNIAFVKGGEPFARLTLNPQQRFRQFNFSTDAILAEGRMRLHIDQARTKAVLKLDSFSYRCYSPAEQVFSGTLAEFDLPQQP